MSQLKSIKDTKDEQESQLRVLDHKEGYLVDELIRKEDAINEVILQNEDMRRVANSDQSQSTQASHDNSRLKDELQSCKEESGVLKASTDFMNNELMGIKEHVKEYQHKLTLAQNSINALQRETQQDRA